MLLARGIVLLTLLATAAADGGYTLRDDHVSATFSDDPATFGGLVDLRVTGGANTIAQPNSDLWTADFVGRGNGTVRLAAGSAVCTERVGAYTTGSAPAGLVLTWVGCDVVPPAPAVAGAVNVTVEIALRADSTIEYVTSFRSDGGSIALWSYTVRVAGVNTGAAGYEAASSAGVRQMMGLYDTANSADAASGRDAVYFSAHDPLHTDKQCSMDVGAGAMQCTKVPEGQGLPLAEYREGFPYALAVIPAGDWFDIATRYRRWAAGAARWLQKGRLETRADMPAWAANITLWMNNNWGPVDPLGPSYGGDPEHVKLEFLAANRLLDLPAHGGVLGLHWYEWDALGYEVGSNYTKCDRTEAPCGFDTHYPNYFPARQGCAEAVAAMKAAGMRVIPYINGQLYDTLIPRYTQENAIHAVQKHLVQPTMSAVDSGAPPPLAPVMEFYQNIYSAVMCPHTDYWKGIMRETLLKIVNDVGFDGAYVDEVGNGEIRQCSDPTHNHTIGGGAFWSEAFREIMNGVREGVAPRSTIYMTEGIEEQVAGDVFDVLLGLQWAEAHPHWHAVYGGYFYATGSAASIGAPLGNGFSEQLTRQFLQGGTMGWLTYQDYAAAFFDPANAREVEYIRALSRARIAGKAWMVHGRATREPLLHDPSATLRAGCFVRDAHDDPSPSIICAIAHSKAANAASASFALHLDPTRHGLPAPAAAGAGVRVTDLLSGETLGTYTGRVTYGAALEQYTLRLLKLVYV